MDLVALVMDFLSKGFDQAKHPRDDRGRFASGQGSMPQAREYHYGDKFSAGDVITDGTAIGRVVASVGSRRDKYPVIQVDKLSKKFLSEFPEHSNTRAFLYEPKNGAVYCVYDLACSHETITDALKVDNLSPVHFHVFDGQIMVSDEYGGLGIFSMDSKLPYPEFRARSLDNIYAGAERLTKLGLPSSTGLRIGTRDDELNTYAIETTLGESKSLEKDFDGTKHPRDKAGRFASAGTTGDYAEMGENERPEPGTRVRAEGVFGTVYSYANVGNKIKEAVVIKVDGFDENNPISGALARTADYFPVLYNPQNGELYACPHGNRSRVNHADMAHAIGKNDMALTHFYSEYGRVKVDVNYAGLGRFMDESPLPVEEYNARALDKIHDGLERLNRAGIPASTPAVITTYPPPGDWHKDVHTTVGLSKNFDETRHPRAKDGKFATSRGTPSAQKAYPAFGPHTKLGDKVRVRNADGVVAGFYEEYDNDGNRTPIIRVDRFDASAPGGPFGFKKDTQDIAVFLYDPKNGSVYYTPNTYLHEGISNALKIPNLDTVHFVAEEGGINLRTPGEFHMRSTVEYSGQGQWSFDSKLPTEEYDANGIDNILAGVEKVRSLGIPKKTLISVATNFGVVTYNTGGRMISSDVDGEPAWLKKSGNSAGALAGWIKRRASLGSYNNLAWAKYKQKRFKAGAKGIPARYTNARAQQIASQVDAARAAIRASSAARSIDSAVPLLGGYNSLHTPGFKSMGLRKQVESAIKNG